MVFDNVISLGGNCEVAHHLRRHFGFAEAQFFDWWITPFSGLMALFDTRFERLFLDENMTILGDRLAVACRESGVIHHHDFPRDDHAKVLVEEVGRSLPEVRRKFDMLLRRLDVACAADRRVLFVRSWREILHAPADYPHWAPDGTAAYDFAGLATRIERRYPGLAFEILFVNYGTQHVDHPRMRFANVQDKGDITDWTGSAAGWDEVIAHAVRT